MRLRFLPDGHLDCHRVLGLGLHGLLTLRGKRICIDRCGLVRKSDILLVLPGGIHKRGGRRGALKLQPVCHRLFRIRRKRTGWLLTLRVLRSGLLQVGGLLWRVRHGVFDLPHGLDERSRSDGPLRLLIVRHRLLRHSVVDWQRLHAVRRWLHDLGPGQRHDYSRCLHSVRCRLHTCRR